MRQALFSDWGRTAVMCEDGPKLFPRDEQVSVWGSSALKTPLLHYNTLQQNKTSLVKFTHEGCVGVYWFCVGM